MQSTKRVHPTDLEGARLAGADSLPHGPRWSAVAPAFVLILWLIAAVWITQRPLPQWTSSNPDLNLYLVQPIIWCGFGVFAWRGYQRLPGAPAATLLMVRLGLVAGVFHVSVLTLTGLSAGFAENPAAGALVNYPKNFLYITSLVFGVEMCRAFVFHSLRSIGEAAAYLITVPAFAAIAVPLGQWAVLGSADELFQIGLGRYLPALTLSTVATLMVADGGVLASVGYRWPLLALQWFFPVLPAHEWPMQSLLGTALPIGAYLVFRTLYEGTPEYAAQEVDEEPDPEIERSWSGWLGTGGAIVVILLFVNGVFGVSPYLLTGISMEPGFGRGDVVIVREVAPESLEVNDVIRFEHAGVYYIHRIIDIVDDDTGLVFVTKGDNVDIPDPPVPAELVAGKAVFMIPKIGLPSLWIRESLD